MDGTREVLTKEAVMILVGWMKLPEPADEGERGRKGRESQRNAWEQIVV